MPLEDGSARATIKEHIASGHSWQPLFLCSSGQQGISADIPDMSGISDMPAISATGQCFAPAGLTSGCDTSPAITKIARTRLMNRPKSMTLHRMGSTTCKETFPSQVCQQGLLHPESFRNH